MNTIKLNSTQEEINVVIEELLNQMDWKMIRDVMTLLEWKWAVASHGGMEVPSIDQLRDTASRLIMYAVKDTNQSGRQSYQGTGGIVVRTDLFVNEITIEVSFELDSADNYC